MAKVKIKLNSAGVRRLLKSKEMQAICTEHAEEIAARCGAGYAVDSMQKETRAIATVYPVFPGMELMYRVSPDC